MEYEVHCDSETSERAGAGGHFQVIDLKDENGKDCTNKIDQGKHYSSLDEIKSDIATTTGTRVEDIEITEV